MNKCRTCNGCLRLVTYEGKCYLICHFCKKVFSVRGVLLEEADYVEITGGSGRLS